MEADERTISCLSQDPKELGISHRSNAMIRALVTAAIRTARMPDHNQKLCSILPRYVPNRKITPNATPIEALIGSTGSGICCEDSHNGKVIRTEINNGESPLTKAIMIGTSRVACPCALLPSFTIMAFSNSRKAFLRSATSLRYALLKPLTASAIAAPRQALTATVAGTSPLAWKPMISPSIVSAPSKPLTTT